MNAQTQIHTPFSQVRYTELNSKAKEIYNFQKVAAVLADYGYSCMWLTNDWEGADFIAVHVDGQSSIKVQLKGRMSFAQKYRNKDIYICFIDNPDNVNVDKQSIYLYPHDAVLNQLEHRISDQTWIKKGSWSTGKLSQQNRELLEPFRIA